VEDWRSGLCENMREKAIRSTPLDPKAGSEHEAMRQSKFLTAVPEPTAIVPVEQDNPRW
jgi:hypothetical protein